MTRLTLTKLGCISLVALGMGLATAKSYADDTAPTDDGTVASDENGGNPDTGVTVDEPADTSGDETDGTTVDTPEGDPEVTIQDVPGDIDNPEIRYNMANGDGVVKPRSTLSRQEGHSRSDTQDVWSTTLKRRVKPSFFGTNSPLRDWLSK